MPASANHRGTWGKHGYQPEKSPDLMSSNAPAARPFLRRLRLVLPGCRCELLYLRRKSQDKQCPRRRDHQQRRRDATAIHWVKCAPARSRKKPIATRFEALLPVWLCCQSGSHASYGRAVPKLSSGTRLEAIMAIASASIAATARFRAMLHRDC